MLNEGMRMGIPDQKARKNTITLYLDKPSFLKHLGIDSEEEIQILLVTGDGKVFWRETGIFTNQKGIALNQILREKNPTNFLEKNV
jgi:hypothetical protein